MYLHDFLMRRHWKDCNCVDEVPATMIFLAKPQHLIYASRHNNKKSYGSHMKANLRENQNYKFVPILKLQHTMQ